MSDDDDAIARLSPVDRVPDPGATIPFRRPTPAGAEDREEPASVAAPRQSRGRAGLDLPSLLLGFSAGVLLSAAVCGFVFAVFVALA